MPISTPSTATNADSTTNAARTAVGLEPERAQHADLPAALAHGPHHDHADAGDADDEAEREVAAHQQEELLLLRHRVLHDVAQRLGLAAVGEEAAGERVGERVRVAHVEVGAVRDRARAEEPRAASAADEHAVVRDVGRC